MREEGVEGHAGRPGDRVVALAGNPNVGKSTIFNYLTGMRQHTGNWPGKTVVNAQGRFHHKEQDYALVDVPGCYSLLAHSAEEEVARDFICFGDPDGVLVVCDATCLERNLNLTLQIMEITGNVAVAVNLMDEAKGKGMEVDLTLLQERLGVPVVGTAARQGQGMEELLDAVEEMTGESRAAAQRVEYPAYIESEAARLTQAVEEAAPDCPLPARWLALRLLEGNPSVLASMDRYLGPELRRHRAVTEALDGAFRRFSIRGVSRDRASDDIAQAVVAQSGRLARDVVHCDEAKAQRLDRRLDRLFTSKATGFPIMLLLLLGIFWLTIVGANYPSQLLSEWLLGLEDVFAGVLTGWGVPEGVVGALVHGGYRVMAWVVSVMLPPMAIFFPLFTLLEDFGYLPRVAFNLDRCFQACKACGKQALTICMGSIILRDY